ncbi:MAG: gliding motility-associated ABC transporter substrate-binding protein GldG [Bacteroidetes bacterium]|nr:gliding motility-associated ABC transporter substrate-binding protein GldG [Bacteroidota bacterium]
MGKRRIYKTQSWVELAVMLVILVILNTLAGFYYKRFDLTTEKRFTLSETSKKLASALSEKLYFKLYLNGEMSGNFKQLRSEIQDMAYEFREASGGKIEIEALDPLKGKEGSERAKILNEFVQKGIEPKSDIEDENGDETRIRELIPGAEFNYKNNTFYANFFEYDAALSVDENFQRAIENIEYEMANALRQCVTEKTKRIIVADGNGEMIDNRVQSFAAELRKYYSIEAVNLNIADTNAGKPFLQKMMANPDSAELILMNSLQRRLNLADLLMIVKPLHDYTPAELFLIDQFLMQGGRVLWMVDPVHIEIDSFENNESQVALDYGLENINSMLNTYGVLFNNDLLLDAMCNRIPYMEQGRMRMINWWYFPLFTDKNEAHIITKNVGAVWSQFPSTLKIKPRKEINTIPLLTSSARSKVVNTPATVEMTKVIMQQTPEYLQQYLATMNAGPKTTGVLLEGNFNSAFANQKRFTDIPFKKSGKSKMVVIADGDLIRNQVSSRGGNYPTGFDRFNRMTFANKKFMLNCIDYMIDDNGLIEIRGKEIGLRLLDKTKIKTEKLFWQQVNILVPIGIVLLFGATNFWIRKRKYAR